MNNLKSLLCILGAVGLLTLTSCDKTKLVQSFNIALKAEYTIPTNTGGETGTITMDLYDDNTLEYTITVNNMNAADVLTKAHVHAGDVVSTGSSAITFFDGAVTGNTTTGIITLTDADIATLTGADVYVNVHSQMSTSGLVRGQIDKIIDHAYNVDLSPSNEVPAVTGRAETGNGYFRIIGSTMHFRTQVNNLNATDSITKAHFHAGAAGANGSSYINLDLVTDQLDISKTLELTTDQLNQAIADPTYVNVHSVEQPSGLLRGQIR